MYQRGSAIIFGEFFLHGGILPQKTFEAFVDRIASLDETVADRLARYTAHQREALNLFTPNEKLNLALQKESLGLALEIAGISRDELLAWRSTGGSQQSFLDGLPGVQVREDAMLLKRFLDFAGFRCGRRSYVLRKEGVRDS